MPIIRIGRRALTTIGSVEKPTTFFDEEVKGFGLLVRPSGARSWIVEYRPGAGGRGVSKRRLVIGDPATMTPEAARTAAKDMLADVRKGRDPAAERAEERRAETVQEILEAWFQRHVTPKRKASTAALYRQILDTHIIPAIGSKRALLVTRQDIARLHDTAANKGQSTRKTDAKPRASKETARGGVYVANRILAILSAAFNWASASGLLPEDHRNPATGIEKFREQARERYLTSEELGRLGAALHEAQETGIPWEVNETSPNAKHTPKTGRATSLSPHVVAAFRLLILTGARLREILNLRWADVDLERGALFLPDSKTGRKTLLLPAAAIEILQTLPRLGVYVIASESAGAVDEKPRADLKKPWRLVTRRAGLEGVRIHDLRHSFASIGAGSGVGLPILAGLLGHAQVQTTQRYAHLAASPLRQAADVIADAISEAMAPKIADAISEAMAPKSVPSTSAGEPKPT